MIKDDGRSKTLIVNSRAANRFYRLNKNLNAKDYGVAITR